MGGAGELACRGVGEKPGAEQHEQHARAREEPASERLREGSDAAALVQAPHYHDHDGGGSEKSSGPFAQACIKNKLPAPVQDDSEQRCVRPGGE